MICTPQVLKRALSGHERYKPTASLHLIQVRDRWIPVQVRRAADKRAVRECAEAILDGRSHLAQYRAMREEHRVAVALCLCQGWSEHLASLLEQGAKEETVLTIRVFEFLGKVPLDHAVLAVRNWSADRDGVLRRAWRSSAAFG